MSELFTYLGDGLFSCRIRNVPGLADVLLALTNKPSVHQFGATHADPLEESFWEITQRASQQEALSLDSELVTMIVGAEQVATAEIEALVRVCNATRLSLANSARRDRGAYEVLSAVVADGTEALLEVQFGSDVEIEPPRG